MRCSRLFPWVPYVLCVRKDQWGAFWGYFVLSDFFSARHLRSNVPSIISSIGSGLTIMKFTVHWTSLSVLCSLNVQRLLTPSYQWLTTSPHLTSRLDRTCPPLPAAHSSSSKDWTGPEKARNPRVSLTASNPQPPPSRQTQDPLPKPCSSNSLVRVPPSSLALLFPCHVSLTVVLTPCDFVSAPHPALLPPVYLRRRWSYRGRRS